MKRIILFFLIVLFSAGVFAQVGTLTVTNVESTPGTGVTVVDYEFSGQAGTYDISAEVSFDNGDTWENIPADDLTGAVTNVTPGGPYSITWDGMASFPDTFSEETVIRLTATLVTPETFILSMEADPAAGGTAKDETDAGPYEENAVINIEAEPNPGYSFVNWSAPAGSFGNAGLMATTFTMPAQHVTVTANFEPIDYTLTLTADPTEGGSVEDLTDDAPYHIGNEVQIKAEANEGWEFVNWTDDDDGDAVVSTDASYTFNMPAANVKLSSNFQTIIIYGDGVTDIDGNEYVTVIIGDQEWMAENLRVTEYRSGDAITTDDDWGDTTDGAYAIYDHNDLNAGGINSPEEMVAAYGKLYNWYAVVDERGLCPEGWSVPSDDDWTALVNYMMDEYDYHNDSSSDDINGTGNALKSCRQVDSPLGGNCDTSEHPRWLPDGTHSGFDEFGFSALPGGRCSSNGSFNFLGFSGSWWSATESTGTYAFSRYMVIDYGSVPWAYSPKTAGLSVRCLRYIE